MTRTGMYATQPFYACDTFLSDWPWASAVWLSNLAAAICLRSVGRLSLRYKVNLFIVCFQGVIGVYAIISGMMFECPVVGGGSENATLVATGQENASLVA